MLLILLSEIVQTLLNLLPFDFDCFDLNFDWSFYNRTVTIFANGSNASYLGNQHNITYGAVPEGKEKVRFTLLW